MNKEAQIESIYSMASSVEAKKQYAFLFHSRSDGLIGIDVLDYDTEDAVDGGWYTIDEAEELMLNYLEQTK